MNSDGHIYHADPFTKDPKVKEDIERFERFVEKPFEEQLEQWRSVIAQRQAERKAKAERD